MKIKGFETTGGYLHELNSTKGKARLAAIFLGIFTLATIYFVLTDQIPTWTLDSQIVVMALGFLLLGRFFTQRKLILEKYKDTAYRHAFVRFVLPGLALVFASIVHIAYMNGPKFTQPTIVTVASIFGWYFLVVGAVLWIRSAWTFGFDNLAMLYVYFPAKGGIINSTIYGILRHPVYAGALRVGIGLACLNMGIYALTFALLLPLGFTGWVRLVEEKELIERFPGYAEYRKLTPAFWIKPNAIGAFWKFILAGK